MPNKKDTDSTYYLNAELPVEFSVEMSDGIFEIGNKQLLHFGSQENNSRRKSNNIFLLFCR